MVMVEEIKLIPPDGGYGWVIVIAYSLHHFIIIPFLSGFGLLFKDKFKELEFSTTDISLIIVTNSAFAMFIGIILGPLLKQLGYRKVAICGAIFTIIGMISTAFASTITHFIITYGIITASGRGIGLCSYAIALNSYFLKNRSKAAGYVMTIWGFGPIIMPQIFNFLLQDYGVRGTILILSGVAANTLVSALLLQPVKWHMKEQIIEKTDTEAEARNLLIIGNGDNQNANSSPRTRIFKHKSSMDAICGADASLGESTLSLYNAIPGSSMSITSRRSAFSRSNIRHPESLRRVVTSAAILSTHDGRGRDFAKLKANNKQNEMGTSQLDNNETNDIEERPISLVKQIGNRIVDIFDLTLLSDGTYVNIALGMSLAFFSEQNFSLLTPFILQDYGLNTQQTATFMTIVSIMDICFRFIAPRIGDFLNYPARKMYFIALVFPVMFRSSLLFAKSYVSLLVCAFFIGIGRGFQIVYIQLVMPSYIPIERLASAIGLQSTLTSICICIGGPFLGYVRDVTGSFAGGIIIINFATTLTILMWAVEFLYKRYRSKPKVVENT